MTWKYRFYLVNSVHFDNLSGMNKVFLFKGEIACFHEWFGSLRAHRYSRVQSYDLPLMLLQPFSASLLVAMGVEDLGEHRLHLH